MKTTTLSKYQKAKLRVDAIRGFYNHLAVFVIINILLYVLRDKFTIMLINLNGLGNPEFLQWVDWNVFGTTIIWGIVLAIHGINVLGNVSQFTKEWENRQIQKYMNQSTD
jgi:hypothetical protein